MNFQTTFTEEQLTYIVNQLAERPYKEVHEIISAIRTQAQEQIAQAQAAAQAPAESPVKE